MSAGFGYKVTLEQREREVAMYTESAAACERLLAGIDAGVFNLDVDGTLGQIEYQAIRSAASAAALGLTLDDVRDLVKWLSIADDTFDDALVYHGVTEQWWGCLGNTSRGEAVAKRLDCWVPNETRERVEAFRKLSLRRKAQARRAIADGRAY